jgi:hypothetical protein
MTDFIERYVNLISGDGSTTFPGVTDGPRDYQEAGALFLVSTMSGRKFYFMSAPETNLYKTSGDATGKILNLWFILIGKSRIARKTISVGKVTDTIEEISTDMLLSDDFTPSALVKTLAGKNPGQQVCWVNDEISSFFEKLRQGDYMTSTDTVLSRIYDGKDYRRETISRQLEHIRAPYLTCLLASTDFLPTLFDEGRLRQGFLNRFIYVVANRTNWKAGRALVTQAERDEAMKLLEWTKALSEMDDKAAVIISFNNKARKRFNNFEKKVEDKIMSGMHPLQEGYMGNMPNFVTRLSAIYRIARLDLAYFQLAHNQRRPFLEVEIGDLNRAVDYAEKAWGWFEKTLELMRRPSKSRIPLKEEHLVLFVESIIKDHGSKNATSGTNEMNRTELSRRANLSKKELDDAVALLEDQGKVRIDVRGQGRGRRKTVYVLLPAPP